jgi:hypothetical protein
LLKKQQEKPLKRLIKKQLPPEISKLKRWRQTSREDWLLEGLNLRVSLSMFGLLDLLESKL